MDEPATIQDVRNWFEVHLNAVTDKDRPVKVKLSNGLIGYVCSLSSTHGKDGETIIHLVTEVPPEKPKVKYESYP